MMICGSSLDVSMCMLRGNRRSALCSDSDTITRQAVYLTVADPSSKEFEG